jgi:hypothetical protein
MAETTMLGRSGVLAAIEWSDDFTAATWVSHTKADASVRTEEIVESVDGLRDELEP